MKANLSRMLRSGVAMLLVLCMVAGFMPTAAFAAEKGCIDLNEMYDLVQTYGPDAAAQVWAQWEEYGYVEMVEKSIADLKPMLSERYTYYTETALPAIGESVTALSAQKDALTTELATLKTELAAKKAELAEVIANVEIGSVETPDINIDVELGNNEQTQVPENDCTVDGEGVKAELEAAVKDIEHAIATIEALITDIEADMADMIALAEQIAAAVAELEKTMEDVAAAAEDVEKAVKDVVAVIKSANDAAVSTFEAARATVEVALEVLNTTMGVAEEMAADLDEMIAKIVVDAEALYNKFKSDLPECINAIPDETKTMIVGSVVMAQQAFEAKKTELTTAYETKKAEITAELTKLAEEYGINEENITKQLTEIQTKITDEVNARYPAVKAEYEEQIAAAKAEAAVKLEALNAELQGYQEQLAQLGADAAAEVIAPIQAQIDRVTADIATVNADLEHAVSHLENAAQAAYETLVAEVTKIYEETIAQLNKQLEELKQAYEAAVEALNKQQEELKNAFDAAVEELEDALNKQIEELNKIIDAIKSDIDAVLTAIHNRVTAVQNAIEAILKGQLEAIEDLKNALVALGLDAINDVVDALCDAVMNIIKKATVADLVIATGFKYVAIGDGSAAAESYVEKLTAALNAEAAKNSVGAIEVSNKAYAGNTVSNERANLSDVSNADLITVGFSNVEFLAKAVNNMTPGEDLDWAAVVGEENVHYVDELLAEVAAKIAEAGVEGELAVMVNNAVEAYAYAAVLYAVELPALVNEIKAVNPEALVIIVGMYNPLDGVSIALSEDAKLDIGEYVDYLVKGVAVHGIAYSLISGNSIYVDAPAVATLNEKTELGIRDLWELIKTGYASLYPSAAGDDYIAAEICDALNITWGLWGDVNSDGKVNAMDATRLLRYGAKLITADELNLAVADVNADGNKNAMDATQILRYNAKIINVFPVEKK